MKKWFSFLIPEETKEVVMTKDEAITLITSGRHLEWKAYREIHPNWRPDLSDVDLRNVNLHMFNLVNTNLCGAKLPEDRKAYSNGSCWDILTLGLTSQPDVNLSGSIYDLKTTSGSVSLTEFGARLILTSDYRPLPINKPLVFISYAWYDEKIVLAIDYWLRLKNILTRMDRRDFFAGSRIRDEIMRVMKDCAVILVFYSSASKDKPWAEFERELAADLEMEAKKEGKRPPRIIYIVTDDTPLPSISEKNRMAIMAKGKRFEMVCEEIYLNVLQLPRMTPPVDLETWKNFVF